MSQPTVNPPVFPRAPLIGIFAVVGLALAAAGVGRITGADPILPPGSVVTTRTLRFEDRIDGAVVVRDHRNGREVDVLVGEQGFVRGTLRTLARERRSEGIGSREPFELTKWSTGRLTLDDAATGRRLELDAFGSDNVAAFARLLTVGATP